MLCSFEIQSSAESWTWVLAGSHSLRITNYLSIGSADQFPTQDKVLVQIVQHNNTTWDSQHHHLVTRQSE
jgi:hypothetical protein